MMKYLKRFNENYERLTHSDIEDIEELWSDGLSPEEILIEMDYKDYITLEDIKKVINSL